jgi:lysophospholipase L1-like esterase
MFKNLVRDMSVFTFKKIFFCCGLFYESHILAQKPANANSTWYQSKYYLQKQSMFNMIKNTESDGIIFLGDSITDGAEWAEWFQNSKIKNRGIAGDITFGVLARLSSISVRKPAKVFLMIGINDLARQTDEAVIVANYRKMIKQLLHDSPQTHIYIQSVLPTNDMVAAHRLYHHLSAKIKHLNLALQYLSHENTKQTTYLDLFSVFADENGNMKTLYTNDGVHLTGQGYQLWVNVLKKYL